MTTTHPSDSAIEDGASAAADGAWVGDHAADHLWMHFTRMSTYHDQPVPVIERGEGAYIWDSNGKRYLDALSGLFVVQAGHGREELARAAYEQARKLAKQYFKLTGKPGKYKVISRAIAYHGTTQGALSITGVPTFKHAFEPLVPGSVRVPNTNFYRAPELVAHDEKVFGRWAADQVEEAILMEGADSVAAVFVEPVQNAGGCFPPPPGYFQRLREICDTYDVLLVSDEVICAYGRLGTMFGAQKFDYQPDMITSAKGLTSGYSPLGATLISDRIFEPFGKGTTTFPHGYTFGGHPVSCAVALANLDIFESEDLLGNVLRNENALRSTLERLKDLPIVGDVRGDGYFFGIEMVKDQATKATFTKAESERVLRGFVSNALFERGLYCRADDRGDTVVQVAPPLICGQQEFDEMESILRSVFSDAWALL